MTMLAIQSLAGCQEAPRSYGLAGLVVRSTIRLPELDPFAISSSSAEESPEASPPAFSGSRAEGRLLFEGIADVGARRQHIAARSHSWGDALEVEGVATFLVERSGKAIWYQRALDTPDTESEDLARLAFGPPLLLALARRHRWTLHGSAVATPLGACVFLGSSGAGKSTLARALDAAGWPRVADDLVVLEAEEHGLRQLTRFPQPALAAQRQPLDGAEVLPVAALCVLAGPSADASLVPMPRTDATVALIRHTAASKLFDRELLDWQLATAARTAQEVPIWRLSVPWHPGGIEQAKALIERQSVESAS